MPTRKWRLGARIVIACLAFAMVLTACNDEDDIADGEVTWYTPIPEQAAGRLAAAFEAETGIEVNVLRQSAGELLARVEAEADNPGGDVLGLASGDAPVLADKGLIRSYEADAAEEIADRFIDPDGYWHANELILIMMGIHTERWEEGAGDAPLPETWEDLIRPELEGEVVMPNPTLSGTGYTFVATQMFRLGEEEAWDYLADFDELVGLYTASGGAPSQLVATGEFIAGVSFAHDLLNVRDAGFPVDLVYPRPTGVVIAGNALINDSPNTDEAEVFIEWLQGPAAGQLLVDLVRSYPVRDDVELPEGALPLADLDLVDYDPITAGEMRSQWSEEFEARFSP